MAGNYLFNVTSEQAEGVITFKRDMASAQLVNLVEQVLQESPHTNNSVKITAEAKQIITIKVVFK